MRPAQRDSEISILKTSPYRPYRPLDFKTTPAQADSEISKLGVGILRILRSLGILGGKTKNKTTPAQRDSEISKLRIPIGPIGPIKNNIIATKP